MSRWIRVPVRFTPLPAHGADDYEVGLKFNIPVIMPVDDDGTFMQGGGPWAGKDAVASNEDIIAWLDEDNALIAREDITHSYPHCWRCKNPVILPRDHAMVRLHGQDGFARKGARANR